MASEMDTVPPFPVNIDFFLYDGCNLQCGHCLRHTSPFLRASDKRLGFDLFQRLIREGAEHGLPAISLGSMGEVFLEKDTVKMIEFAREHGVLDIWVSINGVLLTGEISRKLVFMGLTRVSISVDAFRKETHSKVRGGDYNRLLQNIHTLIDEKKRQGSDLPVLRITCVKLEENEDEREELVRYRLQHVQQVDLQRCIHPAEDKNLTKDDVVPIACPSPWRTLMVWTNGDVSPCCSFFGKDLVVGNVKDKSLEAIWHSDELNALRDVLRTGNYPKPCINCLGVAR